MLKLPPRRILVAMLALVCSLLAAAPGGAATNHHVILVTIDGMAASYLSDSRAALPVLRKLAAEGAVAAGMRVSNPAITWPNHTSLVTGVYPAKHSVLFNGRLDRPGPGRPVSIEGQRDKSELVAVPTLYDQLHLDGYRTAGINWPCTRGATTLDDNFPDMPEQVTHMTPRLRAQLVRAGILDDNTDAAFRTKSAAAHDQIWTAAATHLLQMRPPNLLLLHLLVADGLQHLHGPGSPAAYTALALADAHLGDLLRALEAAGIRERSTVFVTSDHGFARPTKLISPNVVFRKAGLQRPGPRQRAQALSEGGTAFVYLTARDTAREDQDRVIQLLAKHEGISEILRPESFRALHLPDPARNPQMADLILVAQEGYAFSNDEFEDESITEIKFPAGSHGYLASTPEMNGIFVAWGRGIKPGVKLGLVDIVDVAPTIADLFGESLPDTDGKVLREILER